jgi:hypothetical protein
MEHLHIIKLVGAILAVAVAVYSLSAYSASPARKRLILFLWTLGPPIFFYFEYFFQAPLLQPGELQRFKDLQDHASKIWAGLVAVLAVAYLKSDSNEPERQKGTS